MIALVFFYSLVHGWNNQVCVAFVLPIFAVPALVAILAAVRETHAWRPAV